MGPTGRWALLAGGRGSRRVALAWVGVGGSPLWLSDSRPAAGKEDPTHREDATGKNQDEDEDEDGDGVQMMMR